MTSSLSLCYLCKCARNYNVINGMDKYEGTNGHSFNLTFVLINTYFQYFISVALTNLKIRWLLKMIWFKMFLKWQWMDLFHCTYMLSYFCHRQDFYRTWQWAKEAVNPLRTHVLTRGAWWVGVYHSFLYCVLLCFVLVISFCILCSMLPHDSGLSILSCPFVFLLRIF